MELNRSDYEILDILRKNRCYSKLKALTMNDLITESKLSYSKIRKTTKELLKLKYIEKGAKNGCAETFYMTELGKLELINASGVKIIKESNGGNL
ncbi:MULTISPECIES: hypothetical protein [unclassified Clostridium]|uniref:hypothetical protein n=1 Tax=unclassified Clostridium TaxID=2614128 RepID=UPI0025C0AF42|nr:MULTISPECIES: hypothetical protein [unclassified Clostridium]